MKKSTQRNFVSGPDDIYFKVNPSQINFINRVMEGYEYLGVVTTINKSEGILVIRTTPDTAGEVSNILKNLSQDIEYITPSQMEEET